MTSVPYVIEGAPGRRGWRHYARVLRTIAAIEFKMKYADSAMGYLWSLAKPLAYFGVLYLFFGQLFKTDFGTRNFGVYLLIGILLYMFTVDAVTQMVPAIVTRGEVLRRISFPPLLIPLSVSATALITFCVNMLALVAFVAFSRLVPELRWLLVLPLLAELYLFVLGLGLLLCTLYVRFRDIGQLWELAAQLLIFATPVMYPVGVLPVWAQKIVFFNPMVQVFQDVRHVVLGASGGLDVTATTVLSQVGGRVLPIGIALVVFVAGLVVFRRQAPYFAERV